MAVRAEAIADALAKGILQPDQPMWQHLRELEMHHGNFIILPGQCEWFPTKDWDDSAVLSIANGHNGKEVRIIAPIPKRGSHGSLKRLMGGIKEAGLVATFISPTKRVRQMLKAKGWRFVRAGLFPYDEEVWREPYKL